MNPANFGCCQNNNIRLIGSHPLINSHSIKEIQILA